MVRTGPNLRSVFVGLIAIDAKYNCLYIIHADRDASNASPVEPKE